MFAKFTPGFLVLGIFVTVSVAQALPNETDLKVTVMVFSGRTNPDYFFPSDSIPQLVESFKTVSVDEMATMMSIPTTLEYHGILVDNPSSLGNLPQRFLVNKGRIEVERAGVKEILIDNDNGVEQLLLRTARELGVIDDKILTFIETGRLNY